MFEEIANILKRIKGTISADTNVVWPDVYTVQELQLIVDSYIIRALKRDASVLIDLDIHFAPMGNFEGLAKANGWDDEYPTLARRFDAAYQKIKWRK